MLLLFARTYPAYKRPDLYKRPHLRVGTAADTEKTTELIASQLELLRLNTATQSRVVTSVTLLKRMLFRYQARPLPAPRCAPPPSPGLHTRPSSSTAVFSPAREEESHPSLPLPLPGISFPTRQGNVSAALVLGGVDCTGAHLYHIYPHGSTSKLPYVTMGSGSLASMAVFEELWREAMEEADAIEMVKNAIFAGIFNDLGSGSNCDITVIRKGGETKVMRGYAKPNETAPLRASYARPPQMSVPVGATEVLETKFTPLSSLVTIEDAAAPMQL